ncbi:hypothetical protein AYI68_g3919 [Smittium mucronatum]|uniref:Uncharacterized protein n=1 Tax=Smittium mucronatum TaxID=133383 RepID=A0A1R0GYK4_9FUNG|nr:hypothetical protein AYI68_g3919 [Smittium mucronatum]
MDQIPSDEAPPTYFEALTQAKNYKDLGYAVDNDNYCSSDKNSDNLIKKVSKNKDSRQARLQRIINTREDYLKINNVPTLNHEVGLEVKNQSSLKIPDLSESEEKNIFNNSYTSPRIPLTDKIYDLKITNNDLLFDDSDIFSLSENEEFIKLDSSNDSENHSNQEANNDELFDRLTGMIDDLIINADKALKSNPDNDLEGSLAPSCSSRKLPSNLANFVSDEYAEKYRTKKTLKSKIRRRTADVYKCPKMARSSRLVSKNQISIISKNSVSGNSINFDDLNHGYESDFEAERFRMNSKSFKQKKLAKSLRLGMYKAQLSPGLASLDEFESDVDDFDLTSNALGLTSRNRNVTRLSPKTDRFRLNMKTSHSSELLNLDILQIPLESVYPDYEKIEYYPDMNCHLKNDSKDSSDLDSSPSQTKPWNPLQFIVLFYYGVIFFLGILFLNSVLCDYSSNKVLLKLHSKSQPEAKNSDSAPESD